jgi:LmbE family N-acetylglucosaminyl deacetylase
MPGLPQAFGSDAESLVVVAPHPDDDVLGCGALIARAAQRMPVRVVYVTDGTASHRGSAAFPPAVLKDVREHEARRGLRHLGVAAAPRFLEWPDGTVPMADDDAAASLLVALSAAIPDNDKLAVAYPWRRDPHPDHRAVASLVERVLRDRRRVARFAYTVWLDVRGQDDDAPQPEEGIPVAIDSRPWLPAKLAALREHRSQLGSLITDAVEAFELPVALLARALGPVERFVLPRRERG